VRARLKNHVYENIFFIWNKGLLNHLIHRNLRRSISSSNCALFFNSDDFSWAKVNSLSHRIMLLSGGSGIEEHDHPVGIILRKDGGGAHHAIPASHATAAVDDDTHWNSP
jgi:hypothetical protein